MFNTASKNFCNRLQIKLPIIQAPMAGHLISPTFIREVAKAGGLGSLPLGYLSIPQAQTMIQKTAAETDSPFAVNVFAPSHHSEGPLKPMTKILAQVNLFRSRIGLTPLSSIPNWTEPHIEELIDMILQMRVPILSVTFGILSANSMHRLQKQNVFVMGTATTAEEGRALEASGCHAIIAQGYEAGGHRGGGFLASHPGGFIGTLALVPQMVDAVSIPVIAAGGIMDGRGIAATLALGASAVQMGTAFLTCTESTASPMHQQMVLDSPAESTCITSVFTGKPVRSFVNEFVTTTEQLLSAEDLLPYPVQHHLTQELRSAANQLSQPNCAGLWSGQGTGLSRSLSVEALMAQLEQETLDTLAAF